jgi:hypothetical protein
MNYMPNPALIKRFVKGSAFFLFILLSDESAKGQPVYVNPDSLQWINFKGVIDASSPFVAFTRSWFGVTYKTSATGSISAEVKVVLIQDSSWVDYGKLNRFQSTAQAYLLNHEKIHYLLTIIEAKRLKKEILDKKILNSQDLKNAIASHLGILKTRNVQYDAETNHAKNVDAQNKWELLIKNELENLKDIQLDQ